MIDAVIHTDHAWKDLTRIKYANIFIHTLIVVLFCVIIVSFMNTTLLNKKLNKNTI